MSRRQRPQAWRWAAALGCMCALVACDAAPAHERPEGAGAATPADAAARRSQLRRVLEARRIDVERLAGTPGGIVAAREAARAAVAIAEHGGGASYRAGGLRLLDQVTEWDLPGACDAALDAVEIERHAGHATAADARLRAFWERFGGPDAAPRCQVRAQRLAARSVVAGGAAPTSNAQATELGERLRARAGQTGIARLERVEVYGRGDRDDVRAVLYFDGVATHRRREVGADGSQPRRLLFDLEHAALGSRVAGSLPVERGGLLRVRTVPLQRDRVRVALDLSATAEYQAFFLPQPFRIVIDVRAAPATAATAAGRAHRIVLDPGHGGRNPGAKGPTGLRESDVALSLARRTRQVLRRRLPGARVLLTRDDDREVTLEERAAIANGTGADAFVSIHLNASRSPEDRGGLATFVLDTTDDRQALRLAARENGGDEADVTDLQVILASLHREDQVARSRALAQAIHRRTLERARGVLSELPDRGVRSAMFYVLVGAVMPAVLVEASFITRPEEEQALRTDGYRAAIAEGIAEGIVRFLTHGSGP